MLAFLPPCLETGEYIEFGNREVRPSSRGRPGVYQREPGGALVFLDDVWPSVII